MQSILVALLFLGGAIGGLPLGMPPGPEDPALSRIAPEECLFYLGWSGTASPSADSPNHTEQLLAAPETRRFLGELQTRLKAALKQGAGKGERAQAVAEELPTVLELLATRPAAVYVERLTTTGDVPQIDAGLIVNAGDRAAEAEQSLLALEQALGAQSTIVKENDIAWHTHAAPNGDAPSLRWAIADGYVLVAVGRETSARLLARLRDGKPPAWLTTLRERLPVPRTASVLHVDVGRILDLFLKPQTASQPQPASIFEQLGLTKIQSLGIVTGLDDTGCVSRTWLKMDGRPEVFLKLLDAQPLKPADLAPIPADATLAAALRLDADRTFKTFLDLVSQFDRRAAQDIAKEFDQVSAELGFNLREDLLPALGDTWRLYHSPGEGGTLFTNWTAVVSVRDPEQLDDIATVIAFRAREVARQARENAGPRARFVAVEQIPAGDHQISFLNFVGEEVPFAPAWCFTGKELVFSTFPQGVQAYLARDPQQPSLAERPTVAQRLADKHAPLLLVHYDSAEIAKAVYPLVQIFGNMALADLQRDGLDLHIGLLPPLPAVVRSLQPGTTALIAADDGLELTTHRTLPVGFGPAQAVLPILAAEGFSPRQFRGPRGLSLLDALSPERTRRRLAMNNLKQMGLAMHNFHDVFNNFPPAARTDKAGKPLLSWRVQILPFLDQAPLFNQFKQDEPWDSPHNKALIAKMPEVFKAPGSKAEAGKTVYLTLRGENTAFPGKNAVSLRDVTDGTSNTVMVVEAADDQAVIWTKPDDLTFDSEKPHQGLVGLRRGGFLALLCDGSVRFVAETINAETLRRLVLRNDGQAIGNF